jgi:hypothetical protein
MSHYRLGRFLQLVGLLVLPFSVVSNVVGKIGLGQSMIASAVGALVFYSGYVLQNQRHR